MIDTVGGRYELGRPLGTGGMATVVAARDVRLDRQVAVKVVAADAVDPVGRQRFVREARSSAGFSHPNAVAVYDAGESDGSLYLVMELVDGPSLAAQLHGGPLPTERAVAVADDILAALGAAHAAGIVHRDVKPGNILLGPDGSAKLADFGIAKRLDDLSGDLTSTGQFVGTPKYLAPEQVVGEPATAATDLYAVGVVLYEMVTGGPPFDAGSPVGTAIAHRDAPIPDVRAAAADGLPDHVAATIERAMAKDPADRYSSAAEMRAALAGSRLGPPGQAAAAAAAAAAVAAPAAAVAASTARYVSATRAVSAVPTTARPAGTVAPRRRPWWLVAVAAVVAVVAGLLVAALADGDDDGSLSDATVGSTGPLTGSTVPAAPAATAAPATAAPATVAPAAVVPAPATAPATPAPTEPPPTEPPPPPAPTTVGELRALVESDPGAFGEAADDLIDELGKVDDANGRQRAERAADLLRKLDEWVTDGKLIPGVIAIAVPVLEPIATGPGSGQGNGGGDGGDDD